MEFNTYKLVSPDKKIHYSRCLFPAELACGESVEGCYLVGDSWSVTCEGCKAILLIEATNE